MNWGKRAAAVLALAICCWQGGLSADDQELRARIAPSLDHIELQLNAIERNLWGTIYYMDMKNMNFFRNTPQYQAADMSIIDFRGNCSALQTVLFSSGVDVNKFHIEKSAIQLFNVWKDFLNLRKMLMARKHPFTQQPVKLHEWNIQAIVFTDEIPPDSPDYEELLDDIAMKNMELFFVDCDSAPHTPPFPANPMLCKLLSTDSLIIAAGEFFTGVADLRKIVKGLRNYSTPVPPENDLLTLVDHIEDDLNRIEKEFWDTIYKGENKSGRGGTLSSYKDFHQRLYCFQVDCRNLQNMLRNFGVASAKYNPTESSTVIYNIGRSKDNNLRRQLRSYLNQYQAVIPGSRKDKIEKLYSLRAQGSYSLPASETAELGMSYLATAPIVIMHTSPLGLEKACEQNTAFFRSNNRDYQLLGELSTQYFHAVKKMRECLAYYRRSIVYN